MKFKALGLMLSSILVLPAYSAGFKGTHQVFSNGDVLKQKINLAKNTEGEGYGPQSPRDISSIEGKNSRIFNEAPRYQDMNLCNIHFHKNAEHRGGEFTKYAGNGDGMGFQSGYIYNGKLSKNEIKPSTVEVCPSKSGSLRSGDTIEVHYVHSSAQVSPGATLGACLSDSMMNPQLRVETQVYVVVNDKEALDFVELTKVGKSNGYNQALSIPSNTGNAIQYAGSTTGPSYNEKGSPLQVSWSVRPEIAKVDINTVATWCEGNVFKEDHAHGVRNLVTNPDLLSPIN